MKVASVKAPKKVKHNTPIAKSKKYAGEHNGKRSAWIDEYSDCFGLKMHPVTEAFIERFSFDLVTWARKDDSIVFEDFLIEKGMEDRTFYRFASKYEQLGIAHRFAIMCLSARREKGGLRNELNAAMIMKSMPMYSQKWRDLLEWTAKISEGSNAPSTIIVQKAPFVLEEK